MSAGRGRASMLGLALDGLRRKLGRNVLTMAGVFIGVLALTLIISLGEGMNQLVQSTVSSETNLRQIGLSAGFGNKIDWDSEIVIEGDMTTARRDRLRRAAMARTRPGTFIGRRAQTLDAASLTEVAAIPHVESVTPMLLERYRATLGEHTTDATPTLGLNVAARRYADRVFIGDYFSSVDADEVLLHEYRAYQWGYVGEDALRGLVGKTIRLETIQNQPGMAGLGANMAGQVLQGLDLSSLTPEEKAALPGIAQKLLGAMQGARGTATTEPLEREFRIVGILREMEPGDEFNVIEDGNAFQVDVFMPHNTAEDFFLASPINRELGFSRALVMVDASRNASGVETALRDLGYTAFSVSSVLQRIEGVLAGITIVISFLTGIALIVAALGIVNTMVTSVLERTREIGLWKAVGATDGQVRTAFLLEAGLIGLGGGLLGLGAALLIMIPAESIAADMILRQSAIPISSGVFSVPFWLPIAGPALATGVAMLAALYPAHRAARVDPVVALRHD